MATTNATHAPSLAVLGGLVALSFALFFPALDGPFVSDDHNAITQNELVVGPLSLADIFTSFSWWGTTRADAPGYRPFVTASFALNHAVAAGAVFSWHAINLTLHAVVSWLVFVLGRRLALSSTAALAAALLFCLLPIHSEAVVWIVGRAELMAAAAFAGALVLLLDYRRRGRPAVLAAAAGIFLAGLLSKENVVTLLAAPLLLTLTMPTRGYERRRDLHSGLVLLVVLLVYIGVRMAIGPLLSDSAGDRLDNPLSVLGPLGRVTGAVSVLGRYLFLTAFPHPLSIDYSYDALAIGSGFIADRYSVFAVLACGGLAVAAWRSRRAHPAVAFALLLTVSSYSIVSNTLVVIGTVMGERLFYLPTLGLCLAAGPALAWMLERWRSKAGIVLASVALAYVAVDVSRAAVWRSPVALYEAAVAAHPRSARAHMELASAYGRVGRNEEAVETFRAATAIMPGYAAAWYNLGNFLARRQRYQEAREAYESALEHSPRLAQAWFNLALTLRIQGSHAEAAEALREAAAIAPRDADVRMKLGEELLALRRNQEAADAFSEALALGAPFAGVRINRGVANERRLGCVAAIDDYLAVLDVEPAHPVALTNAIACLRATGRHAEAATRRQRAQVANQKSGR